MRPIETDAESVTMINVFTPETPDDQERLVDLLTEFLEDHASEAPGFESAAVHRSTDGGHVASYARWESVAATDGDGSGSTEGRADGGR